jgi:hypothetical protein
MRPSARLHPEPKVPRQSGYAPELRNDQPTATAGLRVVSPSSTDDRALVRYLPMEATCTGSAGFPATASRTGAGVDGVVSALLPLESDAASEGGRGGRGKAVVEECSPPTSETTGEPRPSGSDSPVASTACAYPSGGAGDAVTDGGASPRRIGDDALKPLTTR